MEARAQKTPPRPKRLTDCKHFLDGDCKHGIDCQYRHSFAARQKARPCFDWAKPEGCPNENCGYIHRNLNELKQQKKPGNAGQAKNITGQKKQNKQKKELSNAGQKKKNKQQKQPAAQQNNPGQPKKNPNKRNKNKNQGNNPQSPASTRKVPNRSPKLACSLSASATTSSPQICGHFLGHRELPAAVRSQPRRGDQADPPLRC